MYKIIKDIIENVGLPQIIIILFIIILFIIAPFVGISLGASINEIIFRVSINGILVLSLIPMINTGCGLNFGLSLGILAGLIGAVISIEIGSKGFGGFFIAIGIGIFIAFIVGFLYGIILNAVQGNEMLVAVYVGFSAVSFMCIMWLVLPFKGKDLIWAYGGRGLRATISIESYWMNVLRDFLQININNCITFPTGTVLFFILLIFIVKVFFRTKIGTSMTIVGSNPEYAKLSGVNIGRARIASVILSTVISAIGIIVYQESYGFIQLYTAPLFMPFPVIAAILIGGANVREASIRNVVLGTFLFQTVLIMGPSVINSIIHSDMSETIRIVVSNGMIIYALTRK